MTVHSFPNGQTQDSGRKRRETLESPLSAVPKNGLDLAPTKRRRGKLASERDYARIPFEPWKRDPHLEALLHPDHFSQIGMITRLAYALMLKTRDELIEMHAKREHDMVDQMMADLMEAAEKQKSFAQLLDGAYLRILASACAHNQSGGKFKGVHDMRRKKRVLRRTRLSGNGHDVA